MISEIEQLQRCLPRKQRWEVLLLVGLAVGVGFAEVVTIAALVPFLAALLPSAPSAQLPVATLPELLSPGDDNLLILGGLIVALAVVSAILKLALVWRSERFCAALGNDLVQAIYHRVMQEEIAQFEARNSSDILATVDKVQGVEQGFVRPLLTALTSALIAGWLLMLPMLVAPVLTVVAIILLGVAYYSISILSVPSIRRYARDMSQGWSSRTRLLRESLGAKRELMLMRSYDQFENAIVSADRQFRSAQASNQTLALAPRSVFQASVIIASVVGLGTLVWFEFQLTAVLPILVGVAVALQRTLPLAQSVWNGIVQASGNEEVVRDVIGLRGVALQARSSDHTNPQGLTERLDARHVCFAYSGGTTVLEDANLTIKKREWVGISGPSGAGKSTLLDLLVGFQPASAGTLAVDGEPLEGQRLTHWQRAIGYVREASFLIDGSFADNICFGETAEARDTVRLERMLEIVQLDELVGVLAEGHDAGLGEGGVKLSAGQRQRVAIARALYRQPDFLILDEGTNAIDLPLEETIFGAIKTSMPDLTLILVTHRTQSILHCDRHLMLNGSTVIEMSAVTAFGGDELGNSASSVPRSASHPVSETLQGEG